MSKHLLASLILLSVDPTGLLEEGQIYCRSSDHKWPDKSGDLHDVLQGDVLASARDMNPRHWQLTFVISGYSSTLQSAFASLTHFSAVIEMIDLQVPSDIQKVMSATQYVIVSGITVLSDHFLFRWSLLSRMIPKRN